MHDMDFHKQKRKNFFALYLFFFFSRQRVSSSVGWMSVDFANRVKKYFLCRTQGCGRFLASFSSSFCVSCFSRFFSLFAELRARSAAVCPIRASERRCRRRKRERRRSNWPLSRCRWRTSASASTRPFPLSRRNRLATCLSPSKKKKKKEPDKKKKKKKKKLGDFLGWRREL
jgi:hypothetical protein